MGKTIKRSEYARQQGAQSFRNLKLEVDDTLKITEIGAYPQLDSNGKVRNYVEFDKDGELLRMPIGDASKHKGLGEESMDGDVETITFQDVVKVTLASDRKVNGYTRYPFRAYFYDSADEADMLRKLNNPEEAAKIDWNDFYFSASRVRRAQEERTAEDGSKFKFDPVQNYTFTANV